MRREVCAGHNGKRKGQCEVGFMSWEPVTEKAVLGWVLGVRRPDPCSQVHRGTYICVGVYLSVYGVLFPLAPPSSLSWVGTWILGHFVHRPCFCSLCWNELITPWRLLLGWTAQTQLMLCNHQHCGHVQYTVLLSSTPLAGRCGSLHPVCKCLEGDAVSVFCVCKLWWLLCDRQSIPVSSRMKMCRRCLFWRSWDWIKQNGPTLWWEQYVLLPTGHFSRHFQSYSRRW